jgi:spore coat protein CotH
MTRLRAILTIGAALTSVATLAGQVQPRLFGIGTTAAALFDDSVLHEVRLDLNARDWESLKENFLDNTYYPADFRWRDQVVRGVGIRSRGNITRSGTKPGLRVDFDRYTTDQTFLGLKSIVLRNNTQDPSGMNERLSMLIFRRMGVPASREVHTTLYVNSEYAGLYTIVESLDKAFLKRTLGEDTGYLYEYNWVDPYYFEDRGSDPDTYVPGMFQPQTHEDNPRPEFIPRLVTTVNRTGEAAFRTVMNEWVDLTKFIRYIAVEMFIGDGDGFIGNMGMSNFYLYRYNNRTLFTFLPWDKSEAFKEGAGRSVFRGITDVPEEQQNRLLKRALAYPDLYALYLNTLLETAQSLGPTVAGEPGWLETEVAREYEQIRDAAHADPVAPFTGDDFEAATDGLRVFAQWRSSYVVDEIARVQALSRRVPFYRQLPLPKSRKD